MLSEFPPILSKKQFVQEYRKGIFGNRAPTWNGLDEMEEQAVLEFSPDYQLYHVRNRIAGETTWYNVRAEDLADVWYEAVEKFGKENLYISAMAPHDKGLIQGEVMEGFQGLELFWADAKLPMREALKKGERATGILAVSLLKENLCPNSWEWLNILLDRYQFHVIEFTCFSVNWGTLPGFNTIWWEVRAYQWLLPILSLTLLGGRYA